MGKRKCINNPLQVKNEKLVDLRPKRGAKSVVEDFLETNNSKKKNKIDGKENLNGNGAIEKKERKKNVVILNEKAQLLTKVKKEKKKREKIDVEFTEDVPEIKEKAKKKKTKKIDVEFNEDVPVIQENSKKKKHKKKKKELKEEEPEIVKENDSSSDEEIIHSAKKKRKAQVFSSDDEDLVEQREARKRQKIHSDTDNSDSEEPNNTESSQSKTSGKRVCRVEDSSDEEQEMTPKEKKKQLMKDMIDRLNKKKCRQKLAYFDDEASSEHESDLDQEEDLYSDEETEVDEDNLPMFEHEEFPPEVHENDEKKEMNSEDNSGSDSDDDGFIVSDGVEDESGEEGDSGEVEDREDGAESDCSENEYFNPYLEKDFKVNKRIDVAREMAMITQTFSKKTKKDKQNKKNYKDQMGKYQFCVRSDKNRALDVDEKTRYKRNIKVVKFDSGLKEMRNMEKDDKEFFDVQETCLYGTQVQMFPHTKKRSTRKKGHCDLNGCGKGLVKDEDKVVGAKFFDPINCKFMKHAMNTFGKEAYFWICREHMLEDRDSSDSDSDSD